MKNLWYISIIVFLLSSCKSYICNSNHFGSTVNQKVASGLFDTLSTRRFHTIINFKSTKISGILIIKKLNDNTLAGSLINEFGIKGFDFTIVDSRVKLEYVFKKLDKWYIRKILKVDLHFLFSDPKLESEYSIKDTTVYVSHVTHSLHYLYYYQNDDRMEHADMYNGNRKIASLKQSLDEQRSLILRLKHSDGTISFEFFEILN